jgi:hypothetical protein
MRKMLLILLASIGFCSAAFSFQAETKPVLIVLTSHRELGDTGKTTGFFSLNSLTRLRFLKRQG